MAPTMETAQGKNAYDIRWAQAVNTLGLLISCATDLISRIRWILFSELDPCTSALARYMQETVADALHTGISCPDAPPTCVLRVWVKRLDTHVAPVQ